MFEMIETTIINLQKYRQLLIYCEVANQWNENQCDWKHFQSVQKRGEKMKRTYGSVMEVRQKAEWLRRPN